MNLRKELEARILDLPDVVFKNNAFHRGPREFARFRGTQSVQLRLTNPKIHGLRPDYRLTIPFPAREWVEAHFDDVADLDFVMKLAEQSWKASERSDRPRISERRGRGRVI